MRRTELETDIDLSIDVLRLDRWQRENARIRALELPDGSGVGIPLMGLRGAQPGSICCVGAAVVGRADHGLKYRGVIHHYGSEIRHEHLEASNALPDHVVQLRETSFWQVQDDHMKAVIDSRFPFSFLVPLLKRLLQGVTTLLHRKIHDTGSAS